MLSTLLKHLPKDFLPVALVLSILLHLMLFTVTFYAKVKPIKAIQPNLQVVLVNHKTANALRWSHTLAQVNLDGGGNSDAEHLLSSPLPLLPSRITLNSKPSQNRKATTQVLSALEDEVKQKQENKDALQPGRHLLSAPNNPRLINNEALRNTVHSEGELKPANDSKFLDLAKIKDDAVAINRLEAAIAEREEAYQKRPRRKFVGANVQEYGYALYVEAWRHKVEEIGRLNYPEAARSEHLYGKLLMTVSINADGMVEKIEINRSSGVPVLDEAAKRIVMLGEPYAKFPADIRRELDILSISRTWTFTQENERFE
ncbi:MAG: TonB family protein [Methylophilaceae bacterium]|nr:TonB family protein [Methylophilaceae bacterium]